MNFKQAAEKAETLSGQLSDSDLLYLYARYKQVTVGPCNTIRPGFLDFKGKAKWDAWNKIKDKSKSDAEKEYIQQVEKYL
jgi:diazepam-binding inhibitor (GABA receptor modulating acyl-CoA-binding protein)